MTGIRFAPLVAVSALGVAGRLPFVALPNVALTYVVVFAGGMAFGPLVGLFAGMASMAITDVMLSGLLPAPFANVPAMGLVGLAGAACRRLGRGDGSAADRWGTRLLAGVLGVVVTLAFSILADAATWAIVADYRYDVARLKVLVWAGLAFNVLPAAINGILFAAAITPLARGLDFLGPGTPTPARGPYLLQEQPSGPAR